LGKLKKIRARLRKHILRINEAFTAKNLENRNAMKAASAVKKKERELKLLLLPAREDDGTTMPGTADAFIDLGAEPGADPDSNPANEAAEAAQAKKLAELAQSLYDQVISNVMITRADLEAERNIMGTFRDKLREMILKREAKLARLSAQLTDLNQAIASGGSFAADIWPLLSGHLGVMKSWRQVVGPANAASAAAESKVVDAIQVGAPAEAPVENVTAAAPATNTTADDSGSNKWDDALSDARAYTVKQDYAFAGYGLATFVETVQPIVISVLATRLNVPASKFKIEGLVALNNDPTSVKCVVTVSLGNDPPNAVVTKWSRLSAADLIGAIRAGGASNIRAVVPTGAPTVDKAQEANV
jgi:hypothetical protein